MVVGLVGGGGGGGGVSRERSHYLNKNDQLFWSFWPHR